MGTLKEEHPRAYNSYRAAKSRCTNKNDRDWPEYGGRGIYMCERWRDGGAKVFVEDMGDPPNGHTLDRVDVDGPYSPDNCVWSSRKEQRKNQRRVTLAAPEPVETLPAIIESTNQVPRILADAAKIRELRAEVYYLEESLRHYQSLADRPSLKKRIDVKCNAFNGLVAEVSLYVIVLSIAAFIGYTIATETYDHFYPADIKVSQGDDLSLTWSMSQ